RRADAAPIRFGTDGWRACIADDFTFENVERVAQAYADFIKQQHTADEESSKRAGKDLSKHSDEVSAKRGSEVTTGKESHAHPHVVVGYDRRFLSEQFAERAPVVADDDVRMRVR